MDVFTVIKDVLVVAKAAYEVGQDIKPIIEKLIAITSNEDTINKKELEELQAMSDELSSRLTQPLPEEEE